MYDPIASRYATALYEQLADRTLMEQVLGQLSELAGFMQAEPDLSQLLLNPDVDLPDKLKVCESIWPGQVREEVHDFLRMVLSRGRAEWLVQIIEAFRDVVDEAHGRRRVTVRSARPLPPLMKTRLMQRLEQREGCQVLLTEETEPALIGGLQVQVAHRLIDGTLQTQLTELRHRLKQVRVA